MLLQKTLDALHAKKGEYQLTWDEIAEATGLGKPWLQKLSQGKIQNPGIKQVETLAEWLGVE